MSSLAGVRGWSLAAARTSPPSRPGSSKKQWGGMGGWAATSMQADGKSLPISSTEEGVEREGGLLSRGALLLLLLPWTPPPLTPDLKDPPGGGSRARGWPSILLMAGKRSHPS